MMADHCGKTPPGNGASLGAAKPPSTISGGVVTPATQSGAQVVSDAVDLDASERFLTMLDETAETWTFQTFDDNPDRKAPELTRLCHGTLGDHEAMLIDLNLRGAGIFVMVNRGDGRGRKGSNVTAVRAVTCDTDGVPLDVVMRCGIEPGFVVESSKDRWHAYWPCDDMPLDQFSRTQSAIAAKLGSDPSIVGLPGVLRLPGFFHQKKEPFLVRVLHESGAQPYSAARIHEVFPTAGGKPAASMAPPDKGNGTVVAIDRHADILKLAARFAREVRFNGLSHEAAIAAMDAEVIRGRWTRDVPDDELHRAFAGAMAKYASGEWGPGTLTPASSEATSSMLPPGWKLQRVGELLGQPSPTQWLWRGLVECGSLVCFFGPSGSGKSFVSVDFGACVATATECHGRKVKHGPVVYMAGEGHKGLRKRFLAWSIEKCVDITNAPLHLSSAAIDLAASRGAIVAAIKAACEGVEPVLIIVDTLQRHLRTGANENTGEDMGPLIAAADEVRQAFGCAVVLVHHTGHTATDRERGWSGIRGSLDWSYSVHKGDKGPIVFQCRKAKDHEEPDPLQFELHSVELPWLDEEGVAEKSAVLSVAGDTAAGMGTNQLIAMTALRKLVATPGGESVAVAAWRAASKLDRHRWRDVREALVARGLVLIEGDNVRLP